MQSIQDYRDKSSPPSFFLQKPSKNALCFKGLEYRPQITYQSSVIFDFLKRYLNDNVKYNIIIGCVAVLHAVLWHFEFSKCKTFVNFTATDPGHYHHNHTKRRTWEMALVHETFHVNHHKVGLSDYGEQHFGLDG